VQFQIKKDSSAGVDQLGDNLWPFCGKQLESDLVEAHRIS